jgi:hypothetical protein
MQMASVVGLFDTGRRVKRHDGKGRRCRRCDLRSGRRGCEGESRKERRSEPDGA